MPGVVQGDPVLVMDSLVSKRSGDAGLAIVGEALVTGQDTGERSPIAGFNMNPFASSRRDPETFPGSWKKNFQRM